MSRSTAQRLGDVALVLAGVAVLTLLGRVLAAADISHGDRGDFWSYVGLSAISTLFPAFGAVCASCWMDEARRQFARVALIIVLAVNALAVLGDVVFGNRQFGGGRAGSLMQDAASLLLIAGAFTLLTGIPTRDESPEV